MKEFHVTPVMAKKKMDRVKQAGILLGLSPNFIDVDSFAPGDRDDFNRYIQAFGIRFFSIKEIVTPNHKDKAKKAGHTELVPPLHLWPWSLLVLRTGDWMRESVGKPVKLRNLYRPMSYNRLVAKSGIKSDHPNACGGDFDFSSVADRRKAEGFVRGLSRINPFLDLSLGLGARTLHVGVLSPQGKRQWYYGSYKDERVALD